MVTVVQVVSDTNIGGAGRYLLNYLKYYDRKRYRVIVIVPKDSMLIEFIRPYEDVTLIEAPFMADKSYDKKCVRFLQEKFAEIKPDILHTHASLSARVAGRRAKVGCILSTRHCIEPPKAGIKNAVAGVLNNRLCDYFIGVADAVAKNLAECGVKPEKIRTVYNGVEPIKAIPLEDIQAEKKRLGIKNYEIVFGVFARIEPVKGHRYYIKAIRRLVREGYKAKFLIVGDGSLMQEMKDLVKTYQLEEYILFTGYVKDTTALLNVIDVNVISSMSEAMSLSILEAMSLGKPSIATNAGGNGELVKNNQSGLLVGSGDSASLSDAMIKLIEDNELYQVLAQNAKKEYEEKFTARRMVDNLEHLYEEVLQK